MALLSDVVCNVEMTTESETALLSDTEIFNEAEATAELTVVRFVLMTTLSDTALLSATEMSRLCETALLSVVV